MNQFFKKHSSYHLSLLLLACPMIVSNISVPLLGLVDTAVIGHLAEPHFLAGIALGSGSIAILFWLASFLRMSTTALIAQAFGQRDFPRLKLLLLSSLLLAFVFAILLISLSPLITLAIEEISGTSLVVMEQAKVYFSIRVFSAPAALCNLVLLGFMLGMNYGKGPFYLVLATNIVNIALDILFVMGFGWEVAGAAWASLIADYCALMLAVCLVGKLFKNYQLDWQWLLPKRHDFFKLLTLNRDIFFRSLILQLCFTVMTFYGARLGELTLAANAVLLNFLMLVSFALDGIAYATESKVGQAKGRNDQTALIIWVKVSVFWGAIFALLYCLMFALFGGAIISLLTDINSVQQEAGKYLYWLTFLPIIAMACFLFDGVFVGLARAKEMRNSMCISALIGFLIPLLLTTSLGNHGLWLAMTCFMAMRGVTLFYRYHRLKAQGQLLQ